MSSGKVMIIRLVAELIRKVLIYVKNNDYIYIYYIYIYIN